MHKYLSKLAQFQVIIFYVSNNFIWKYSHYHSPQFNQSLSRVRMPVNCDTKQMHRGLIAGVWSWQGSEIVWEWGNVALHCNNLAMKPIKSNKFMSLPLTRKMEPEKFRLHQSRTPSTSLKERVFWLQIIVKHIETYEIMRGIQRVDSQNTFS